MAAKTTQNLAGFGPRLLAFLVDLVVYWIFAFIVGMVLNMVLGNSGQELALKYQQELLSGNQLSAQDLAAMNSAVATQNLRSGLISLVYIAFTCYLIVSRGQTLGKMALNLKVVNADTGKNVDWVRAILRELVGKFISTIIIFVGYIWVAFDSKKQAWHDKIANTIVIKTK